MHVDLVLRDANVLTVDPARPRAREVAVLAGRIVAVGDAGELDGLTADRTVGLDGATLTPAFLDAHNHMAWFGLALGEIDLVGQTSVDALYDLVAQRAATLGPDEMVVGSGYDDNLLGCHPDRDRLDAASGGRPVWLKHRSGHIATVSTSLADRLGILDGSATCPEGGRIVVGDDGVPTGTLQEQAQNIVVDHVVPYPTATLSDALARASQVYAREGLTHVTECGMGRGWLGKSPIEAAAYQDALDRGVLDVRVRLMPCVDALHDVTGDPDDPMTFGLDLGMRTGFGGEDLTIGAMKIWLDGSLLGRTAAMNVDYCPCSGRHMGRGYLQDDAERMRRQMIAAHVGGWDVAAHAIGDAAVDLGLDVFEEAQRARPRPDARHRIEHAGMTSPEEVARMARLGVTPTPQVRFLHDIGDSMAAAVGPDREGGLYRHRSFLDAGCRVPGSSDRPVADGRPLAGIESMVLRRTSAGKVIGPDERVDAATALKAYTLDAAWIAREEHRLGSVTPGKLADLAVLGADVTAIDPDGIADTPVLATLKGGLATQDTGGIGLPGVR